MPRCALELHSLSLGQCEETWSLHSCSNIRARRHRGRADVWSTRSRLYLLLNVTCTQVIKAGSVCSRRYKAPLVKRMMLKYCSTVIQVALIIGVNRAFLF